MAGALARGWAAASTGPDQIVCSDADQERARALAEEIAGRAAGSGCGRAFMALVVEALTDAGVEHGLTAAQAARIAVSTMGGSAALLAARRDDAPAVRRQVTSPGGVTAAGLAALERTGVRAAFAD